MYLKPYNHGDVSTLTALRRAGLGWRSWREACGAWNEVIGDGPAYPEESDSEEDEVAFAVTRAPFQPSLPIAAWVVRNGRPVNWQVGCGRPRGWSARARGCCQKKRLAGTRLRLSPSPGWQAVEEALEKQCETYVYGDEDEAAPWEGGCRQLEALREWARATQEGGAWSGRLRGRQQRRASGRYGSGDFCSGEEAVGEEEEQEG